MSNKPHPYVFGANRMYSKIVFATCLLAYFAIVLSAYARLSDAGLGCDKWPACYEESALRERQPPQGGVPRGHASWQWKLHSQVVQLLGILAIIVCGLSWKNRKILRQSPLLPTLLLGLMVFLAVFGVVGFYLLSRPVIVSVHLAGGVAMLALLSWIMLRQIAFVGAIDAGDAKKWRAYSWFGFVLLLAQTLLGGWVSSNFATLACADFPLCKGSLLPEMDFSNILDNSVSSFSMEKLTAIHWLHRFGALLTVGYWGWLATRIIAVKGLRKTGTVIMGLIALQFMLGVANVLGGMPLAGAVLHNALAMLLQVTLVLLLFRLQNSTGGN